MADLFRAAQGRSADWQEACLLCIRQLGELPAAARVGFVYASDPLADSLDLIVARLREATGIGAWIGTGGAGVCASGREYVNEGAIVTLVAMLPEDSFRVLDCVSAAGSGAAAPLQGGAAACGVVSGDPREPDIAAAIARLSEASGAFLVGGLSSAHGSALQIARQPAGGALSGVLLGGAVEVVTGLSQGCTPVGPAHEVTASQGPWVLTLDGRPSVDVLKEDIGDVLARNLERIGGFIHVALPTSGSDRPDYVVRNLLAIDLRRAAIAVGDLLRPRDRVMFVKRDGTEAQADLRRMLDDLRRRTGGRPIRGALYHSCVARGPHMFGPDSAELKTIERALGPMPLAGFFTNGEIFRDRLYSYSGVLTVFL
ncbi:MAG: FIST signal transduction protein [Geminicoccaceae bacterium]